MPDITNPTSDQIKAAMIRGTPATLRGIEYACIIGYCCRPTRPDVNGKRRLYLEVELKSKIANSVTVGRADEIIIHERE